MNEKDVAKLIIEANGGKYLRLNFSDVRIEMCRFTGEYLGDILDETRKYLQELGMKFSDAFNRNIIILVDMAPEENAFAISPSLWKGNGNKVFSSALVAVTGRQKELVNELNAFVDKFPNSYLVDKSVVFKIGS